MARHIIKTSFYTQQHFLHFGAGMCSSASLVQSALSTVFILCKWEHQYFHSIMTPTSPTQVFTICKTTVNSKFCQVPSVSLLNITSDFTVYHTRIYATLFQKKIHFYLPRKLKNSSEWMGRIHFCFRMWDKLVSLELKNNSALLAVVQFHKEFHI